MRVRIFFFLTTLILLALPLPLAGQANSIEDITVTIYGSSALARGTMVTTNSSGVVISKLLFTDVFALRNAKWQAVSAQENAVTTPSAAIH